jgi:hypothetical protein
LKINLIILAAIALLIVSCKFKEGDFSVKAPEGWIRLDTIQNGRKFVAMHSPAKSHIPQFVENIRICIIHSYNLDSYISTLISEVRKTATYYENKGNGVVKTKQFEAKWIQHVLMNSDKEKIEQKIYMIVCSARKDSINKMQSKIDEVLNSLRIF